jgi:hypothetical protein
MSWLRRVFGENGDGGDLLADLVTDYRAEAEHAEHLREHAGRARYPQAAAALRELAAQEDRHAAALRDLILARGGGVPPIAPDPIPGRNPWERAVNAHKAAQAKRQRLLSRINAWDPQEPAAVEVLRRIEREDAGAMAVYDELVMRADPQSLD